jgi:hypothetical protein
VPPRAASPLLTRTRLIVALLAAAITAALTTIGATPASAGQYRVYSCQTPGGRPATSTGWRFTRTSGAASDNHWNNCALAGGELGHGLVGNLNHAGNSQMGLAWAPPTGVIARGIWVAYYSKVNTTAGDNSASYVTGVYSPGGRVNYCPAFTGCTGYGLRGKTPNLYLGPEWLSGTENGQDQINLDAACGTGNGGSCGSSGDDYNALNTVGRAEFLLEDNNLPAGTPSGGTLHTATYLRGRMSLSAQLTDGGSGVRSIALQRLEDGTWKTQDTQSLRGNKPTCQPIDSNSGLDSYTDTTPCYTTIPTTTEWDTDKLAEGRSSFRVIATDAASNVGIIVPGQTQTVDRTPPTSDYSTLEDVCTAGERVKVTPRTSDAISGVETTSTIVLDNAGKEITVAADGTIACPPAARGPLTTQTTSTDKAGNTGMVTRSTPLVTKDVPVVEQPTTPPATEDSVGNGGTVAPQAPQAPQAPPTAPTPDVVTIAPAPAPTPAAPPKASATAAADALLTCTRQDVVLTEAYPLGNKDVLRGVADKRFVGKTVTLRYGPKRQVVASLPVGADGTFTAMVKAPKGKSSRGNSARYQAAVGAVKSSMLKRVRRMYGTQTYRTANGAGVYVAGRVTKPFAKNSKVTIQIRRGNGCSSWSTVKSTRVDARGNYGVTIPVPSTETAVVVRAIAQVRPSTKTVRTTRTQSMPAAVQMR